MITRNKAILQVVVKGKGIQMKNYNWEEFGTLVGHCYENIIGVYEDNSCWQQGFDMLMGIVREARKENADFARELYQLDEMEENRSDVQGWLEDCMDDLEIHDCWEQVLANCEELIGAFEWKEASPSDWYAMKARALDELNRGAEAEAFCRDWIRQEPENMQAASSIVYTLLHQEKLKEAEELIDRYLKEDTECTDDNDILFIAAERLYEANGNKKRQKQVNKALEEYDRYLETDFLGDDEEDSDDYWTFL